MPLMATKSTNLLIQILMFKMFKKFPVSLFIVYGFIFSLTTQHFVMDRPGQLEIDVKYSDFREGG